MTKKKRGHPDAEEILARPWCYYCERDFDDLKILISHQKAKHFKCDRCGRRLNTAGGLSVHLNQVHKETLTVVENALPNRSDLNIEIFGMEGIPEDVIEQHKQRVLQQFYENEANRRAASGNVGPSAGAQTKKPKLESAEDLKTRLAAFKAKKAAGEPTAPDSGNATPISAAPGAQSPAVSQSPASFQQPVPSTFGPPHQPQQPHPTQASPIPPPFQQSYGQPYGMPPHQSPFQQPQSPFPQGPPGYAPPMQQFPPFPQPGGLPFLPQQPFPPQQFGPGSPQTGAFPPQHGGFPPYRGQAGPPSQLGSLPRPPSLPPTPGLPQRPSFAAPPVNAFQMQQLHQGHLPPGQTASLPILSDPRRRSQDSAPGEFQVDTEHASEAQQAQPPSAISADVDDLIASVKGASAAQKEDLAEAKQETADVPAPEKKVKKEKETKLVYSDNELSPEEKMALMSRYAFNPAEQKEEFVLGDANEAAFTGPVVGQDDVIDHQG